MLDYYAREFPAVEVNSTYYRIPHPRTFEAIRNKVPAGFEFVVKTHHDMTHLQKRDPQIYHDFSRSIRPLRESGMLTGILAQFPYAFRRTPENEDFLRELRERLADEGPLFVEFRHRSWLDEEVFHGLDRDGLGYVSVDEPDLPGLMPPVARVTGPIGYVRFHGRNRETWWPRSGEPGERDRGAPDFGPLFRGTADRPAEAPAPPRTSSTRYDYSYNEDELREWVEKIRDMTEKAKKTFVFFNNCHVGQAATSAKLMRKLLEGEGML
jgi:uncharacterized protein YecE (DUF72 family)